MQAPNPKSGKQPHCFERELSQPLPLADLSRHARVFMRREYCPKCSRLRGIWCFQEAPKRWLLNIGEGPPLGEVRMACSGTLRWPGSVGESFHWAKVVLQTVAEDGKTGVRCTPAGCPDAVSRQADEGNANAR